MPPIREDEALANELLELLRHPCHASSRVVAQLARRSSADERRVRAAARSSSKKRPRWASTPLPDSGVLRCGHRGRAIPTRGDQDPEQAARRRRAAGDNQNELALLLEKSE